mgnify:CR=1 FL=1
MKKEKPKRQQDAEQPVAEGQHGHRHDDPAVEERQPRLPGASVYKGGCDGWCDGELLHGYLPAKE